MHVSGTIIQASLRLSNAQSKDRHLDLLTGASMSGERDKGLGL